MMAKVTRWENDEGKRWYYIPELGREVPSVTTIIGILEKFALRPWYAKIAIQYIKGEILDTITSIDELRAMDVDQIIKDAKASPKRIAEEACDIGKRTHVLIEDWLHGGYALPDADTRGPFTAFCDWWRQHNGIVTHTERTVWSRSLYAGTLDIVAWLTFDGKRGLYLIDIKTSNGFYVPEMPLQLAAYRRAHKEMTGQSVDGMGIIRLDKKTGIPHWKEYGDYRKHLSAFLRLKDYFLIMHKEPSK